MPENFDAKKYICAPCHGQRGAPWTRKFKPGKHGSVHQILYEEDFGTAGVADETSTLAKALAALNR